MVESHESLPWQRRGYLREAMLDQLSTAAGFDPLEKTDVAAVTAAGEEERDSVREFLDQQRSGWGAKFAFAFEEIGLETIEDLQVATVEEMEELAVKLAATGAGS